MRRLFLVFLLLAIPFQSVWATAAAYCRHEAPAPASAAHFGHHEHRHGADAADVDGGGEPDLQAHGDCSACHLACAGPVAALPSGSPASPPASLAAQPLEPLPAVFPDGPDRPQWSRLA